MPHSANRPLDRVVLEASRIVIDALRPRAVRVYVFGSRARGDAGMRSDIDLAIVADRRLPRASLAKAREALEESTIPQRVDLVDLAAAPPALHDKVLREGIQCSD